MKSNPQALFFDTGVLIALFSRHPSEKSVAEAALEYIPNFPHASPHVVLPSLVELFYRTNGGLKISPKDVRTNLDALGISLFPLDPSQEKAVFDSYSASAFRGEFDFADYFICRAALVFPRAEVLTIDRRDLPLALARAIDHAQDASDMRHDLRLKTFK